MNFIVKPLFETIVNFNSNLHEPLDYLLKNKASVFVSNSVSSSRLSVFLPAVVLCWLLCAVCVLFLFGQEQFLLLANSCIPFLISALPSCLIIHLFLFFLCLARSEWENTADPKPPSPSSS